LASIDSEEEWDEFQAASSGFRPPWGGQAWVGARYDGGWKWPDGRMVDTNRFASGEAEGWRVGKVFASSKNGKLYSQPAISRRATAYVVEYGSQATSTYTINTWAQSHLAIQRSRCAPRCSNRADVSCNHPHRMNDRGKFYHSTSLGGSDVPVFTEGSWADVTPRVGDAPPRDLTGRTRQLKGLARVTIDRYRDQANNVAFMDGSVRNIPLPQMWKLKWHRQWQAPARLPALPAN